MNPDPTSLDRLHDIVTPPPVSWWPPAPGWYWVMGFALVVVLALAVKSFSRWQHNRYRREALAEFARLKDKLKTPGERPATLLALSELLKRTALTAFPREEVATLTGTKWFEFLDRTGHSHAFSNGDGTILENAIYDPRTAAAMNETTLRELAAHMRDWLAHHHVEAATERSS
jgi:hypothetical protein